MLGWASRDLLLASENAKRLLPGSGIVKATVVAGGKVTGTWRLAGSGPRRTLEIDWFDRQASKRGVAAEARDVARFLATDVNVPEPRA